MEDFVLPWTNIDSVFIGGSTKWKLSNAAKDIALEARKQNKHVHMGRVNSIKRLSIALEYCDSIDGTSLAMFSKTKLPDFIRFLKEI
jgi:hypothetical protein